MSDRAVSETLGFVLVFALVTGTIGIVYATGIAGLESAQHEEKIQNVERAFDVLADNVADISEGSAPSRATEVKLAGGAVVTGAPMTIQVEATNTSDPSHNATVTVAVDPIVYEDRTGTSIVYASGALIRSAPGGAVMVQGPRWVTGPNKSVVSLVDTHGSGGGIAGDGAVLVVTQREKRSLGQPFVVDGGGTARVNVTVTSPRVDAWEAYFEDAGFEPVDATPEDGAVTYQFETDALYVPRTTVDVTVNR